MNPAYKLSLVFDQLQTVAVTFEPFGKHYTYLVLGLEVHIGQEVIVETGNTNELKVVKVVEVHDEPQIDPRSPYSFRWVVSNMGTTAREKQAQLHRIQADALAILSKAEKSRQRKQIAKELEDAYGEETLKRVKALTVLNMADGDPLA